MSQYEGSVTKFCGSGNASQLAGGEPLGCSAAQGLAGPLAAARFWIAGRGHDRLRPRARWQHRLRHHGAGMGERVLPRTPRQPGLGSIPGPGRSLGGSCLLIRPACAPAPAGRPGGVIWMQPCLASAGTARRSWPVGRPTGRPVAGARERWAMPLTPPAPADCAAPASGPARPR